MNVGKKIKKIRQFRGLKQAELGQLLGMGDTSQARIGQYEIGFRTPSKELLDRMAKVLDVNPQTLYDNTGESASELMELFFWLEEDHPGLLHIFEMKRWPGERINTTQDINIYYHDNEYWPARRPHGFWLNYGTILDSFMEEWAYRQHERRIGLITDEEYFEWKINWPETCDDCGRALPHKEWRKQPEDKEKQLAVLRKLLPKDNRDIDALPDLQRLTDEQFAPLIPDLFHTRINCSVYISTIFERFYNFIFYPCSDILTRKGNLNLHPHISLVHLKDFCLYSFIGSFANTDHLSFLVNLGFANHTVLVQQHQSELFIAAGQFILLVLRRKASNNALNGSQHVYIQRAILQIQKHISRKQKCSIVVIVAN